MKNTHNGKKEIDLIRSVFILLAILGIGYKVFDLYYTNKTHTNTTDLYQRSSQVSNAALIIESNIYKIHTAMQDIVSQASDEKVATRIKDIKSYEQSLYEALSSIEQDIFDEEGRQLTEETTVLFKESQTLRDNVIKHARDGELSAGLALSERARSTHIKQLDASISRLYTYTQKKATDLKKRSEVLDQRSLIIDLFFSALLLAIFYFIANYSIKRFTRHLDRIERLNDVLSVILDVNELIVRAKDPKTLIKETCSILTKGKIYGNAGIVLFDDDEEVSYIESSDISEASHAFNDKVTAGWTPHCIEKSTKNKKLYSCTENTSKDCLECPLRDHFTSKSAFSKQLTYEGKEFGYLTLSVDEKDIGDEHETALLDEVANDIAYVLHNLQTEQTLKKSKERYRALFENIRTVELLIDSKDGAIVDCNKKALDYYGYDIEQMKSMHISDINLLTSEEVELEMEQAREERRDMFNFRHRLANGEIRDVEVYSGPIELDGRTLLYSIIFDVTERRKLEHFKEEVQERYHFAIEAATSGIWDWDLRTNEVYYSPALKALLGYQDDELKNQYEEWETRIHPDDKQQIFEDIQASHESGAPYKNIHRLRHKDGHWIWVEARAITLYDDDGKPVRMIGSHIDITKDKEYEETIVYLKELYDNIIDSVDNLIFVKDIDSVYIACNSALEKLLGLPKEQIIGKSDHDLFSKEIADEFREHDRKMLEKRQSRSNFEWVKDAEGNTLYLLTVKSPLFDSKGDLLGLVGNSTDFTEQQRLYELVQGAQSIAKLGSWEYDITQDTLTCSDEIYRIYGFTDTDRHLTKKTFIDRQYPDDRERVEKEFQASLESKETTFSQNRILRADDGELRYVQHRWKTEYVDGDAVKTVGTTQDVTEQKKAEKALQISNDKFEKAFNKTPNMIMITHLDTGRIYDVNQTFEKTLGYDRDELIGKTTIDIGLWTDTDEREEYIKTLQEKGSVDGTMYTFNTKEKSIRFAQVYANLVTIDDEQYLLAIADDVTAAKALEIENRQFIDVLDQSINELHVFDLDDLHFTYVNKAGLAAMGYSMQEMTLLTPMDILGLDVADEKLRAMMRPLFHGQRTLFFDNIRQRRKDGSSYPVETRLQAIEIQGRKQIIATVTDMTEQYKTKAALAESEERFKRIIEQSPYAIELYDLDGVQREVNRAHELLWDIPSALTVDKFNIFESDEIKKRGLLPYIQRAYDGEIVKIPLTKFDAKNVPETKGQGRVRYLNTMAYPLKDASGKIKNIIITHEDVTDKENTLQLLEQKTKELETIIQEAPNPIILHNEDGKVLMVNKTWELLTGYSYEEIDTIENWTLKAYGKKVPVAREYIDTLYTSDRKSDDGEYDITTKEGEIITWQFSSAPLGVIDGRRTVISSAMDITELKRKDEMMIIQSRHAAMGEMISMIAHQWRQPISVIAMDANNMLLDIALEEFDIESAEKYSRDVLEQTRHLSKTIDDFRNFFKPDKEVSRVRMQDIIEETLSIVKDSITNNAIELKSTFTPVPEVDAYPRELMQVFVNIINNSKDILLAEKSTEGMIEISVYEDDTYVNTAICDNGTGIDDTILPKIFDPYFTTKDAQTGTGLGLYMSKMIIEQHLHGIIEVNTREKGVCFTVRLPKQKVPV